MHFASIYLALLQIRYFGRFAFARALKKKTEAFLLYKNEITTANLLSKDTQGYDLPLPRYSMHFASIYLVLLKIRYSGDSP